MIYNAKRLAWIHEAAKFQTIAAGYVGFIEDYLTSAPSVPGAARRWIHQWLCWMCNMDCTAWARMVNDTATPAELGRSTCVLRGQAHVIVITTRRKYVVYDTLCSMLAYGVEEPAT